jgi:misacylated tRNA(Ala) deacylase
MAEKDYDRKMHSAEHILNSVMDRRYECGRSFRSHIEKKKSKCDYHIESDLSHPEISSIEEEVNRIISENIPLTEEFVSRNEAEASFFTGKLPPDSGDHIRIVRIGKYDACPCIGPHVSTTSEIGKFIISTVSYEDGILRIRFRLE